MKLKLFKRIFHERKCLPDVLDAKIPETQRVDVLSFPRRRKVVILRQLKITFAIIHLRLGVTDRCSMQTESGGNLQLINSHLNRRSSKRSLNKLMRWKFVWSRPHLFPLRTRSNPFWRPGLTRRAASSASSWPGL